MTRGGACDGGTSMSRAGPYPGVPGAPQVSRRCPDVGFYQSSHRHTSKGPAEIVQFCGTGPERPLCSGRPGPLLAAPLRRQGGLSRGALVLRPLKKPSAVAPIPREPLTASDLRMWKGTRTVQIQPSVRQEVCS